MEAVSFITLFLLESPVPMEEFKFWSTWSPAPMFLALLVGPSASTRDKMDTDVAVKFEVKMEDERRKKRMEDMVW